MVSRQTVIALSDQIYFPACGMRKAVEAKFGLAVGRGGGRGRGGG